jgi:hypothetical protein
MRSDRNKSVPLRICLEELAESRIQREWEIARKKNLKESELEKERR